MRKVEMPTGYTAELMENGKQTFEEFVWLCARAFGAFIMMRDEPLDAPIPDKFSSDDWHCKEAEEARAELSRLQSMSENDRLAEGERIKRESIDRSRECLKTYLIQNSRIDAMLERVKAWNPPTSDHAGLKKFMVEQLEMSRHGTSYTENDLKQTLLTDASTIIKRKMDGLADDIVYHQKHAVEDEQRDAGRNDWIQQLRNSVPVPESIKQK